MEEYLDTRNFQEKPIGGVSCIFCNRRSLVPIAAPYGTFQVPMMPFIPALHEVLPQVGTMES